jgi:hypothetical protein
MRDLGVFIMNDAFYIVQIEQQIVVLEE